MKHLGITQIEQSRGPRAISERFAQSRCFFGKLLVMSRLWLVEAAGVEPATRIENTQLIDSEIANNAENATISKSAVQSLYKHC